MLPYEGSNDIAWAYTAPGQWFGGGIQSRDIKDMSNFRNGKMTFRVKIPANVAFKVGVGDTYTNQNWVSFPANTTTYGLVRNGDWGTGDDSRSSVLAGTTIALQSLHDIFMFANDTAMPSATFQFAIDDIVWDSGTTVTPPPPPPTQPQRPDVHHADLGHHAAAQHDDRQLGRRALQGQQRPASRTCA